MIGTTLSHYRIVEKLGAGGMGEVYRAEDTRLSRQVAIKVLPDVFAGDPERLARFEREAKLLASLNHPNIAAIHGLEEHEGKRFLVLELVEGHTLAERLHKGPLPVEEALEVCRQVAEGLEAAHEKGIIHRDLKPANVKVTPEGKVKVLDFGLARALHDQAATADMSHSPTITDEMTRPGVVLGTAAYMSPEQAKGKTVDKRADIWAFGCVLYECLTGKAPFKGETVTETVAKILEGTPDWNLLPVNTPAVVRSLLRQCLQKDPSRRLHHIVDARVEILEGLNEPAVVMPVAQRFPLRWVLSIAAGTLVLGVLIGPAVMKYLRPAASPMFHPVVRSPIRLEPGLLLDGWRRSPPYGFDHPTRTAMALSGDGRFIVYAAVEQNPSSQAKPRLYLRRLNELEAKPIAGTEGGVIPFLSPDDRWVGFWANGKLMKVPVDGGVATALCDIPPWPFGFSWGANDQIVFASSLDSGLSTVSATGGKPEMMTIPEKSKEEYSHRLPHCLPARNGILFTITGHQWDVSPRVAVIESAIPKWRVLLEDAADARYVVTGHLAFLRRGMLMAVPFDLDRLEVTGQPVPAVADVMQALNISPTAYNTAAGQFSVSPSGSMAYVPGGILPDMENSLVWVDHKGNTEPVASFRASFLAPRVSPDGQRIIYSTFGIEKHVWIYDLIRSTATKLTSEGKALWVTWTPNGQRVAFSWLETGPSSNIYWQPADGSSPMERLTRSEHNHAPASWSPDGETLAFVQFSPHTSHDILFLHMRDRKVVPFLNSRFEERHPEISPDGRWIAYAFNESGRFEVYVQPFPGPGGKAQISSEGGEEPLWSPSGKQLFYRRGDQVWVVDVKADSSFSASKPRMLFEQPGFGTSVVTSNWDISPDGQRFLMVKMEERKPQPVTEMILVQNWLEELKRLVPASR